MRRDLEKFGSFSLAGLRPPRIWFHSPRIRFQSPRIAFRPPRIAFPHSAAIYGDSAPRSIGTVGISLIQSTDGPNGSLGSHLRRRVRRHYRRLPVARLSGHLEALAAGSNGKAMRRHLDEGT